ncbi:enoyl-CoA hydratase [Salipaludibacillus neizhouensis]|uniref:Enoyl-CoA hydratase n=1 Tax=Salipaludibacillus neizhouensis TaxID=885475 RepID=A0A3A9K5U7_9BACI|nr:enoyl-CoA hydratase/isomerase family protein [Salipaludibacillus neizhouensis]RKL67947.1 enoyl-CoA hydratase [Salipaludibacillus neizhouensis]
MSLKQTTVLYNVQDGVATITMNRPHVKNAINTEMHEELYEAFLAARKDGDVKVILLTGIEGSFSSGADLKSIPVKEMKSFDYGAYLESTYNKLIMLIDSIEKPTVAHMNGTAVGAGLSLALACDFRFADPGIKIALSFLHIGLTPDAGASYFLPRIIGFAKALELALGDTIDSEEALRIGLIQDIGHPEKLIHALTRVPMPAYSSMKQNMKAGTVLPLRQVLDAEVTAQRAAGKSKDHHRAIQAFLKRSVTK